MADETMCKLHSYLKDSEIIDDDLSEQDFCDLMFGITEQRIDILKWLISQFSEDYKQDLQQAQSVSNVLMRKLHELELTSKSNKISFVKGNCSTAEQRIVYWKLLRALNFVSCLKEPSNNILPVKPQENISIQGNCSTAGRTSFYCKSYRDLNMVSCLKEPLNDTLPVTTQDNIPIQPRTVKRDTSKVKKRICFDLSKAVKNLDKCKQLLQTQELAHEKVVNNADVDEIQQNRCQAATDSFDVKESDLLPRRKSLVEDCETDAASLISLAPLFSQCFGHLKPLHPERRVSELVCPDLSANVHKLHCTLKSISEVKAISPNKIDMAEDFDSKKMLEDIKGFESSSHILKLKAKVKDF